MTGPEDGRGAGGLLVGRDDLLARVRGAAAALAGGTPVALVVTGDPGLGKTALWRHGLSEFARVGTVLSARPEQQGRSASYSTLRELVLAVQSALGAGGQVLHADEPWLGSTAGRFEASDVAMSVADLLRRLEGPMTVAVDDSQWVDAASARVLRLVLRWTRDRPVGVFLTTRAAVAPDWVWGATDADLELHALEPLDEDQVDTMLRSRLGVALRRPTLRSVCEQAGGNPFFALELTRSILQGTSSPPWGPALPPSLSRLVSHRIRAAASSCGELLLVAAASTVPTVDLLADVLGSRSGAALQHAVDLRLLEVDEGRVRFTHPLLAAAAYDLAEPSARRRVHHRLAALTADPEGRARHATRSTDLPDAAVAAVVEAGARAALDGGASESAAMLARQAADLTPRGDDGSRRARRMLAADAAWIAGNRAMAERELTGLLETRVVGTERAGILRRLATLSSFADTWTRCVELVDEALGLDPADPALVVRLHAHRAFALMQSGDVRASEAPLKTAQHLARTQSPDLVADVEALALLHRVITADTDGDDEPLRPRLARLGRLESSDTWLPTGSRRVLVGAIHKWLDDFEGARAVLEDAYRWRWDRAEDGLLVPVLFQLTELEIWSGRYDVASRLGEVAEAVEQRGRAGRTARAMRLVTAGLLAGRRGRLDEAGALAEEAQALAADAGDGRQHLRALGTLGHVALADGRHDEAVRHLARAEALRRDLGYAHPGVVRTTADFVEALLAHGDLDLARSAATGFVSEAERAGTPWATSCALRSQGLVALTQGDRTVAVDLLRRAADVPAQPDPYEDGRTRSALGRALRQSRHRIAAREELALAAASFERLGAEGCLMAARAELARVDGRAHREDHLTATEASIADLVAQGRSNKEIAAALFVSPKTVEAHLSSTYRRLGLHSRTELAAYVHTHRT